MRYQIICSNDCHNWNQIDSPGSWNEVWNKHQNYKRNNPDMTYHIIPG